MQWQVLTSVGAGTWECVNNMWKNPNVIILCRVTGGQNAAEFAEHLLNNRTPFVTTQVSHVCPAWGLLGYMQPALMRTWFNMLLFQVNTHSATVRISEKASRPQEFLNKYEELKSKKYVLKLEFMHHQLRHDFIIAFFLMYVLLFGAVFFFCYSVPNFM